MEKRLHEDEESQRPLTWALRDAGFEVTDVWDFVNGPTPKSAIPLLLRHIKYSHPFTVKEGIARSLMVKGAPREVWRILLEEYLALPGQDDDPDRDRARYKSALGIALDVLSTKADFDQLVELAVDTRHGGSRRAIIGAIARKNRTKAGDILLRLLNQDDVMVAVINALSYLRDPRARAAVETLSRTRTSDSEWDQAIRRAAKKYLTRIA